MGARKYKFCQSIFAGRTDLSLNEIEKVVRVLARVWNADPYHITRHNCLLFSEDLVERIGLGHNYPEWLKHACVTATQNPGIAPFVDSCWEITKEITKWQKKPFQCTHHCQQTQGKCHVRADCLSTHQGCFPGQPLSDEELAECSADGMTIEQLEALLFTTGPQDLIISDNADETVICETTFCDYDILDLEVIGEDEVSF